MTATENKAKSESQPTITFAGVIGIILYLVYILAFMIGAAKISYDKYHSIPWAIVDFFFASFYYIYYAFFVSKPSPTPSVHPMAGGKWRL